MNGAVSSENIPSGIQGVCPTGWHLPSDVEWAVLVKSLDPSVTSDNQTSVIAGIKLNEAGSAHWLNTNSAANNESNFTALPGGMGYINFVGIGYSGGWWSTTRGNDGIYYRNLQSNNAIFRYTIGPEMGMSVRCLKN